MFRGLYKKFSSDEYIKYKSSKYVTNKYLYKVLHQIYFININYLLENYC